MLLGLNRGRKKGSVEGIETGCSLKRMYWICLTRVLGWEVMGPLRLWRDIHAIGTIVMMWESVTEVRLPAVRRGRRRQRCQPQSNEPSSGSSVSTCDERWFAAARQPSFRYLATPSPGSFPVTRSRPELAARLSLEDPLPPDVTSLWRRWCWCLTSVTSVTCHRLQQQQSLMTSPAATVIERHCYCDVNHVTVLLKTTMSNTKDYRHTIIIRHYFISEFGPLFSGFVLTFSTSWSLFPYSNPAFFAFFASQCRIFRSFIFSPSFYILWFFDPAFVDPALSVDCFQRRFVSTCTYVRKFSYKALKKQQSLSAAVLNKTDASSVTGKTPQSKFRITNKYTK